MGVASPEDTLPNPVDAESITTLNALPAYTALTCVSTVSVKVQVVPVVQPLEIALEGATCQETIPDAAVNVT